MRTRRAASAGVLVSAIVHLLMWFDGVRHQSVGPAFLLNAAGGAVIAVLLVTWRHWVPPLLAIGFGASTLGAFVLATTVGLFGVHDHWAGAYVWTAAIAEVTALVAGAVLLVREGWLRSGRHLQVPQAARRPLTTSAGAPGGHRPSAPPPRRCRAWPRTSRR